MEFNEVDGVVDLEKYNYSVPLYNLDSEEVLKIKK